MHQAEKVEEFGFHQKIGLVLGPALFLVILLLPAPTGLEPSAWQVVAITAWMAVWWALEAVPVPATSLLPLILFPLLKISDIQDAAAPFAHPIIFLLLGGFIAAMALERWDLHKRIALNIITRVGDHPAALLAGFMAASAFLSMWISNTATTLMMVPIALSVSKNLLEDKFHQHSFTIALLLGCAWSASIGGVGTIIGTPPNAFVVSFMQQNGLQISFLQWMMLGVPVVIALVPVAWWLLSKVLFKFDAKELSGGQAHIAEDLAKLGPMSSAEKRVALVFLAMAAAWIGLIELKNLPGLSGLSNSLIAVAGALLMFVIPAGGKHRAFLLDWNSAVKIPWGVLLLFGGGLSLAAAVKKTGLALWLGDSLAAFTQVQLIVLIAGVVLMVIFLTELTSNTATTATLVPVLAALAVSAGLDPLLLAAPTAMAASCAFMLPVATAPNAVIFSSGQIRIAQMVKAGFWLNLLATGVISLLCYQLIPVIFKLTF